MNKQYRIPGLIKFESSCIKTLSLRQNGTTVESLVQTIADYIIEGENTLSSKRIFYRELTPRNRAALFTLKGIVEKQNQEN